ncbi:hypothetical protein ADL12_10090 [Streptomyces regalis]|uniref:Uncharacterized protein n=2 Tax=Streptomyces regalis TaxID=68262 RepID=A0A0X3VBS7_9ACTN|nr:hypothetical protein ADL12_10090 [Streptomyces regalis]
MSYSSGPPANTDLRDMKWSSLAGKQAGSIYKEYANGRYGHLAIWDRELDASEITDFWKLGSNGGAEYTEAEDNRISRLARYADFGGDLALDSGQSTLLSPSWESGATALEEIQKAAEDASGYAFMDGDGRLTFHNRSRRQSGPLRYTLSDSSGLPFEDGLTFEMDDDRVINEVAYQRTGGISATVRDSDSVGLYGRKTRSIELRLTSDARVTDAAYSLLYAYSAPIVRCDQVTLNVSAVPALSPIALGIEIGDRIKLVELPKAAPASTYEFYVEAIDTDVQADGATPNWTTVLSLSPATVTDVFVLEDATNGFLDSSVGLAY